AGDNGIDVQLFERYTTVFNTAHRHTFKIANHDFRILASVCVHHRYDNVYALLLKEVSILEHLIGFTDTRGRADINAQARFLAAFQFGEQRFRRWPFQFGSHPSINGSWTCSKGELLIQIEIEFEHVYARLA